MPEDKAPLCPVCGVRKREFDGEPPLSKNWEDNFSSECLPCFGLSGTRDHTHTYYGSPAQVKAGTVKAGHSWRTTVSLVPIMVDGEPVGFRCRQFDECGWERRFTPEEMELCPMEHKAHGGWAVEPTMKALCSRDREHRLASGEVDVRGHITDHGRRMERERSDAANWDPGGYIER